MAAKKPNRVRDKKVAIVFDEDARREYLLGFRKRKNERRKKAHEQLQKLEREKKKQTKEERKKTLIEQVEKQRMELEALESDDSSEDVVTPSVNATFEHPEHIVTVTTINDIDLTTNRMSCISPNTCVLDNSKKSSSAPEKPTGKLKMHQNAPFKKRKGFKKAKIKKSQHGQKGSLHKGRKGKASNKKRKGSHQASSSENSKQTKRS